MRWHCCVAVSDAVGIGHLVRCLSLEGQVPFEAPHYWIWTNWTAAQLGHFVDEMNFTQLAEDAQQLPEIPKITGVLIDMPSPPDALLAQLTDVRRRVLLGCSDARLGWADVAINVAEGRSLFPQIRRDPENGTLIYEGAGFAPLRPEFLRGRLSSYDPEGPILVVMGGTDAARLTLPIVQVLISTSVRGGRRVIAICSDRHLDRPALLKLEGEAFQLLAPTPQIAPLLEMASVAVLAPGNLLFEALALQTPAIAVAQNNRQRSGFQSYPWLIADFAPQALNAMLSLLLTKAGIGEWRAYAVSAQSGKTINYLLDWFKKNA